MLTMMGRTFASTSSMFMICLSLRWPEELAWIISVVLAPSLPAAATLEPLFLFNIVSSGLVSLWGVWVFSEDILA
jgi:hypothetical protein